MTSEIQSVLDVQPTFVKNALYNEDPCISLGMPVYNGEKLLRDALNSLLLQSFTNFELIISDNASVDGTEEICREYANKDKRIIYFRQNTNIGAIANFQFVLDRSQADFFMWTAHDDTWNQTYLHNALQLLKDNSIDFVFPSFKLQSIKLEKECIIDYKNFKFIESNNKALRVLQFMNLHHLSHKCNIVYSLFRTNFIRKAINIQDIGNDGALGALILYFGRGHVLPESPFNKRYENKWPEGISIYLYSLLKKDSKKFITARNKALEIYKKILPEYIDDIIYIFDHYHDMTYKKNYQICNINTLLSKWIKE